MITLRRKATSASGLTHRTLGRVALPGMGSLDRENCFLVVRQGDLPLSLDETEGYSAIFSEACADNSLPKNITSPLLSGFEDLSDLTQGSIIAAEPSGFTYTLYRPESSHNVIIATGRCNSNCLMCSQPPVNEEWPGRVDEHLRMLDLIESPPSVLGMSGGEPTLLGVGLEKVLGFINERFPETSVHMLTNGRLYSDANFVARIAKSAPASFCSAIPLYSDVAAIHDYIVQSKGAFEATIAGLYNTARHGMQTEIRVVLHKQTIPRLLPLMEFIYRNLSFVGHVALMGLENMGYVKKNWDILWVDPVDYKVELEEAVKFLFYRGMNISIYNLPLCVLPKATWTLARQSISDFKTLYLGVCQVCVVKPHCSGLFASETRHSRGIQSFYKMPTELEGKFTS